MDFVKIVIVVVASVLFSAFMIGYCFLYLDVCNYRRRRHETPEQRHERERAEMRRRAHIQRVRERDRSRERWRQAVIEIERVMQYVPFTRTTRVVTHAQQPAAHAQQPADDLAAVVIQDGVECVICQDCFGDPDEPFFIRAP
jgi:hypothetical protein